MQTQAVPSELSSGPSFWKIVNTHQVTRLIGQRLPCMYVKKKSDIGLLRQKFEMYLYRSFISLKQRLGVLHRKDNSTAHVCPGYPAIYDEPSPCLVRSIPFVFKKVCISCSSTLSAVFIPKLLVPLYDSSQTCCDIQRNFYYYSTIILPSTTSLLLRTNGLLVPRSPVLRTHDKQTDSTTCRFVRCVCRTACINS